MVISFCGVLTILFIGLKLIGYITWPWIWVVSPFLIGLTLDLCLITIHFKILKK